jgi:CBS domain containing-hemolysin-like protein
MSWELSMLIAMLSVAANGFFAGSETGFTTASRIHVLHQARKGRRGAALAARLLTERESVIVTTLVGNNVAVVVGTSVAAAAFIARFGEQGESWAAIVMAVLNIVFGEVLPKSWFRAHAESSCLWSAPLIVLAEKILAPVRWISLSLADAVVKLLGQDRGDGSEATLTRERILRTVKTSAAYQEIDEEERHFLARMVDSSRLELSEVLTPLAEVSQLRLGATVGEARRMVRESGHSRLLVLDERGRVQGLVLFRDLLKPTGDEPIRSQLRDVVLVDESMGLEEGILALTSAHAGLAVAMGTHGQATGIVTMEDLLEPLVGEIADEHDPLPAGTVHG